MITFVVYHVPLPPEILKTSKALLSFHRMNFDYERMLDLTFRSALLFHPGCRLVLLTSLQYQPKFSSQIEKKVAVVRYDVDETEPMVCRSWAEVEYCRQHDFDSDIVILDGDMLVNDNLESLFKEDFDIAFTYNEGKTATDKKMPINGGIKLIHSDHRREAFRFLQKVYDLCNSDHLAEFRTWWGDQYALIEAIGAENFWHRSDDKIGVDGVTLQLLPCETYNFSPQKRAHGICKEWNKKKILHFRGARKRYMIMYWDLYLALRENQNAGNKRKKYITQILLYPRILLRLK